MEKKDWSRQRKVLEGLLHNFPDEEKDKVLYCFDKEGDCYKVKAIDLGLSWSNCENSFEFYYFTQMRFAYYLCRNAPDKLTKQYAYGVLKDLTGDSYSSEPYWKTYYKTFSEAVESYNKKYLFDEDWYYLRKKDFIQKSKKVAKEFGF